ncbi:MAG: helix-turn-helix domain-containing protein [Candidatus Puniceispirillaceae bacterium]
MTPFGELMRHWRDEKQKTLREQAEFLGVSQAYLSALEHGKRGKPSFAMVDQICVFLDLIWDDAESLKKAASLSHPKPTIDASDLSADAVYLANLLALNIDRLSPQQCKLLAERLETKL